MSCISIALYFNMKFEKAKQSLENVLIEAIETLMKLKVTPEDVCLGSDPPSHLDFQTSREIFQHAFCRGGVDFFWNNPIEHTSCLVGYNVTVVEAHFKIPLTLS